MTAYYNEHDAFAAQWLRELIVAGHIAPGVVDTRSIEDVLPSDLEGFTQCHFFAGIGVWSLALRQAGWADDRPIWTGSCPCQPFSAAGKGNGFADERHLWPAFHWLIEQCRPELVVGEQVASKDGLHWLDLVQADLEGSHYASGALDTCAAGFGAPHIRQRLYWVAYADRGEERSWKIRRPGDSASDRDWQATEFGDAGWLLRLADTVSAGRPERWSKSRDGQATGSGSLRGLADAGGARTGRDARAALGAQESLSGAGDSDGRGERDALFACGAAGGLAVEDGQQYDWSGEPRSDGRPQSADSRSDGNRIPIHPLDYWRDADWLLCRDPSGPRFRPVKPGTFPMAPTGTFLNRLAEVRGAGNAVNLAQAQGFIEAVMGVLS